MRRLTLSQFAMVTVTAMGMAMGISMLDLAPGTLIDMVWFALLLFGSSKAGFRSPAFLFTVSWMGSLLIYDIAYSEWYFPLKESRPSIIIGALSFVIGCSVGFLARAHPEGRRESVSPEVDYQDLWRVTVWYAVVGLVANVVLFTLYPGMLSSYSGRAAALNAAYIDFGGMWGRCLLLTRVAAMLGCALAINYGFGRPIRLIVVSLSVLVLVVMPRRAALFQVMLVTALFLMYSPKVRRRRLRLSARTGGALVVATAGVLVFLYTQQVLGKSRGILSVLDYLCLNFPNYEAFLQNTTEFAFGRRTFYFPLLAVQRVCQLFGWNVELVNVSLSPTMGYANADLEWFNTLPVIREFYGDLGIPGVICGMLAVGFISGRIYKLHTRNPSFRSALVTSLVAQCTILSVRQNLWVTYNMWWEVGFLLLAFWLANLRSRRNRA